MWGPHPFQPHILQWFLDNRANMEYKSTYQLYLFKYSPDYRGEEMSTKLILCQPIYSWIGTIYWMYNSFGRGDLMFWNCKTVWPNTNLADKMAFCQRCPLPVWTPSCSAPAFRPPPTTCSRAWPHSGEEEIRFNCREFYFNVHEINV